MSSLAIYSLILGVVMGAIYAAMIIVPGKMRLGFKMFPRAKVIGWVFSAVALAWASWHLYHMSLGPFGAYKALLYVAGPVVYGLVVICMDELLAARSLGALMVLIPAPLLDAARVNDSSWRLVVVVAAYVMITKGIFLIFSPYLFRKGVEKFIVSDKACRLYGICASALAILIISLALIVY